MMKNKKILRRKGNIRKDIKGKLLKNKNIFSKEYSSFSNEDDSEIDSKKLLFMAFEKEIETNEDMCEEEGEVNLEGEE